MKDNHFEIIEGNQPVLLSAPHVFGHRRPSLRGVIKQGEPITDKIVIETAGISGAYGIYSNRINDQYDPNFNSLENNAYKQEVKRLVKEKKISLVIDIHGLSDSHNFDFGVSYCKRYGRSRKLTYKLLEVMGKQKDLKQLSYYIGYMSENNQETITEFASTKLHIPAIQLEVARYIREDKLLYAALCKSIADLIAKM